MEPIKLALIPPISLVDMTDLTDYQLMLPQLFQSRAFNSAYMLKYVLHCNNPDQFVILDNGANEGYEPLNSDLFAMAWGARVNEVVIPDVMGDAIQTRVEADQWRHMLDEEEDKLGTMPFGHMLVAQGPTEAHAQSLIDWATEEEWITTIGLPRSMCEWGETGHSSRIDMADAIEAAYPGRFKIHFLGGDPTWPREFIYARAMPFVRSMDTSLPFNWAAHGQFVNEEASAEGIKRPEDYFELPREVFHQHVLGWNVYEMIRWQRGDYSPR